MQKYTKNTDEGQNIPKCRYSNFQYVKGIYYRMFRLLAKVFYGIENVSFLKINLTLILIQKWSILRISIRYFNLYQLQSKF